MSSAPSADCATGWRGWSEVEERARALDVRPDIAGYADLAHAFDLHGALLAARATLDCALERSETRGAHNRSDFLEPDPGLQVNLVWSLDGTLEREPIAPTSASLSSRSASRGPREPRPPTRIAGASSTAG